MPFNKEEFDEKRKKFDREYKRVEPYIAERRTLTSDADKIIDYKESLVETYNDLISFVSLSINDLDLEEKIDIQNKLVGILRN